MENHDKSALARKLESVSRESLSVTEPGSYLVENSINHSRNRSRGGGRKRIRERGNDSFLDVSRANCFVALIVSLRQVHYGSKQGDIET